jgi:hypothetical protein
MNNKELKSLLESLDESQLAKISDYAKHVNPICTCANGWTWVKPAKNVLDRYAQEMKAVVKDGDHLALLDDELEPVCIAVANGSGLNLVCKNNASPDDEINQCYEELQKDDEYSGLVKTNESKSSKLDTLLESLSREELEEAFAEAMMLL